MRAFFLYPLYGALLAGLVMVIWRREYRGLLLACALIPVAIQYAASSRHAGSWAFLDPQWAGHWRQRHLEDNASGYDTVSWAPYRWYVSPCDPPVAPPQQALQARDWRSLVCLGAARLQFYLGSYSSRTFHYSGKDNMLGEDYFNRHPDKNAWHTAGLVTPQNVSFLLPALETAMAGMAAQCSHNPADQPVCRVQALIEREGANGLLFQRMVGATTGVLEQRIRLQASEPYTASAAFWASVPQTLRLSLEDRHGDVLAERTFAAGAKSFTPQSVTVVPPRSAVYRWRVEWLPGETEPVANAALLVLKPRLNVGTEAVPLQGISLPADAIRSWQLWRLVLNATLLLLAVLAVWKTKARLLPTDWSAVGFVALSVGMALVVVPEQRFFVMPLVTTGLTGVAVFVTWAASRRNKQEHTHDR